MSRVKQTHTNWSHIRRKGITKGSLVHIVNCTDRFRVTDILPSGHLVLGLIDGEMPPTSVTRVEKPPA
jgi:hypothetical protein